MFFSFRSGGRLGVFFAVQHHVELSPRLPQEHLFNIVIAGRIWRSFFLIVVERFFLILNRFLFF